MTIRGGIPGMPFTFTDRLDDPQLRDLHEMYQNEWWSRGRTLEQTRELVRFSDFVFGACEEGRLVAFARVLSDRVFKAVIFDVIVRPQHRGKGLGAELVSRITDHPDLAGVRHFELYCLPELVPFYEKLGFSTDVGPVLHMRRVTKV